jgi:hypothetical protein
MKRINVVTLGFLGMMIPATFLFPATAKSYYGRVSLFGHAASSTYDQVGNVFFSELILSFSLRSTETVKDGFEYGIDVRGAGYPSSEARSQRLSVYDAFGGLKFGQGTFSFRLGQMWLNEIGGLGSLAGGVFEFRLPMKTPLGRFRAGVFGGYEPKILDVGFIPGVRKFGGYVSLEGVGIRRHVLAFVGLQNAALTERSVLILTNYIPVGNSFFLYQSAEYDLVGPAGTGSGNLTYFYANARYSPVSLLELQATYHRGRSFDTRTIINDRLNGRPIDPRSVEGYLFESVGGRLTLRIPKGLSLYAGYSQDRNNLGDERSDRFSFGLYASNLLNTGLELNVSDWKMKSRTGSSYDSWSASLGKNISQNLYLEGFFSSSVSVFRLMGGADYRIESYPRTLRFGLSSILNIARVASLQVTAERTTGDRYSEFRLLSGLSYRF